jgi:hypothetical protein
MNKIYITVHDGHDGEWEKNRIYTFETSEDAYAFCLEEYNGWIEPVSADEYDIDKQNPPLVKWKKFNKEVKYRIESISLQPDYIMIYYEKDSGDVSWYDPCSISEMTISDIESADNIFYVTMNIA